MSSSLGQLEALTYGERLVILRRRSGENQRQAAARLDLPLARYQLLEVDKEQGLGRPPGVGKLAPNERCFLYRRRAGKTRAEVAADLGRCQLWVTQMERGRVNCDELVGYWES